MNDDEYIYLPTLPSLGNGSQQLWEHLVPHFDELQTSVTREDDHIQHPLVTVVQGPRQCGKTHLIKQALGVCFEDSDSELIESRAALGLLTEKVLYVRCHHFPSGRMAEEIDVRLLLWRTVFARYAPLHVVIECRDKVPNQLPSGWNSIEIPQKIFEFEDVLLK